MGQKSVWVQKSFWVQKRFWVQKILGPNNFGSKKIMLIRFGSTNFWVPKIFEKVLCPKKFESEKILGLKKFWFKNIVQSEKFRFQKIFGSKKILGK